jgi:hypothetical protein
VGGATTTHAAPTAATAPEPIQQTHGASVLHQRSRQARTRSVFDRAVAG